MTDARSDCGTGNQIESDLRVTLFGPLPPPIHGQSVAMSSLVTRLIPQFRRMRVIDTSWGDGPRPFRRVAVISRTVGAWWSVWRSDVVYIAVKADWGMWLTSATALLARLAGAKVILHHHSYGYVRTRQFRMVVLVGAAGPRAHHIVLSRTMARDLANVMPEIRSTQVLGNAGLVDLGMLDLPLKRDGDATVLGHLSNLSVAKGISETVSLAVGLHRANAKVRLIIGGPIYDDEARHHLERAALELGESFEYRGPLNGDSKRQFFRDITHFVFPTNYVHEAAPLVLYEAMAAGVVCVATRQGSICEQLEGAPSVLADSAESFVDQALPALLVSPVRLAVSNAFRQAFLQALSVSERQFAEFAALMGSLE